MANPTSVQAILDRVKKASAAKTASDTGGVSDPTDRGEATAPSDPPIVGLPPNKPLTGPVPADDQTLKPGGTGTDVPSTESQNAKDEAAKSPTDPLGKIATDVTSMAARLAGITAAVKGASAPAAAAAPAATPAVAPAATPAKSASEAAEFDQTTLAKLASLALKTEEGQQFMAQLVERELGAKEASAMIESAVQAHYAFGKSASLQEQEAYNAWALGEQQKAAALEEQQKAAAEVDRLYALATPEEKENIQKMASLLKWADENLSHPALKQAFAAGMEEAAADTDTLAQEGGEGQLPTGEEEPSPEEIQQLIQQAVESGQLPPEVAMQLMDQLAQGGSPDGGTGSEGEMDSEMTAAASLVA